MIPIHGLGLAQTAQALWTTRVNLKAAGTRLEILTVVAQETICWHLSSNRSVTTISTEGRWNDDLINFHVFWQQPCMHSLGAADSSVATSRPVWVIFSLTFSWMSHECFEWKQSSLAPTCGRAARHGDNPAIALSLSYSRMMSTSAIDDFINLYRQMTKKIRNPVIARDVNETWACHHPWGFINILPSMYRIFKVVDVSLIKER